MAVDESQTQKRGDRWSKDEEAQNSTFCVVDGPLSSQDFGVGGETFQRCKGRVVLRGDIVKDFSGSNAVFTEQGSSASQMTAAKVMDVISRLRGCAGQAADAISAYTQVKMEDAPKLLKIPKSECPYIWIRPRKHKWPKSWSSMENPNNIVCVCSTKKNWLGRNKTLTQCRKYWWKRLIWESQHPFLDHA